MQYVLSDAEYAYVDELKKTLRSWEIIFVRFKLKFQDCPVLTQAKLQRCYGYLKNRVKREPGVASSPIESHKRVAQICKKKKPDEASSSTASSPIESHKRVGKSRKRKKPSTKKSEALPTNESDEASSSTASSPIESHKRVGESRNTIDNY